MEGSKMKRAIRRYHYKRLKYNRKKYWFAGKSEKYLGMCVTTPSPCSCYMCGNPRKYFKSLTMQEKKANVVYKEFINALYEV